MKRRIIKIIAVVAVATGAWLWVNRAGEKPDAPNGNTVTDTHGQKTAPIFAGSTTETNAQRLKPAEPEVPLVESLRSLLEITDSNERNVRVIEALSEVNAENIYSVVAWLENTIPPDKDSSPVYQALLAHWATFDGPAATQYAFHSLEGDLRLDCGVAATRSWASVDLASAGEYIKQLPEAYGKDYIIYDFVFPYVDSDPLQAMQWVQGVPDEFRGTAALHATNYWLTVDEKAATDWLIENSSGHLEKESIREVALHWVRHDLQQADQLVSRLQQDEAKAVAMESIVNWLASQRPTEVAVWLNEFENTQLLDRVYATFALRISRIDAGSAVSWAESITDDEYRLATISEIGRRNTPVEVASDEP